MKITKGILREIIREEIKDVKNSLLTEVFMSDTLKKLASGRLNRDFFSATASKYGIKWDKVEDHQIERLRTPKKKGISFAVAGKNVEHLPSKTRQSYYGGNRIYVGITKGRLVAALKDGKPLYMGSYREPEVGTSAEVDSYSKSMVGLDTFGYRSLKAIQEIPGLMWYHLDLNKREDYMGADEIGKLRKAARYGASKFTTHQEFSKAQQERYSKAVAKMKNDPKRIKKEVTKATKHLDKMMKEILEGKSPRMKKAMARYQKEYGRDYIGNKKFEAASQIANRSSNLFDDYSTYLKETNSGRSWRNDEWVNKYAETVVNDTRNILKLKATNFIY
jgi:hypothetical protein